MKILLTGSQGYIGKAFLNKFKKKHEIIAPKKDEMDLTKMPDVIKYIKGAGIEAVVHTASVCCGENMVAENVMMFKNLQSACSMYKVPKIIVIGSATEYGKSDLTAAKEQDAGKVIAKDDIGYSKLMITELARADSITTVLRFFDLFGRAAKSNFLNNIIKDAAAGKELSLDKNKKFSAISLLDAVRITELFCVNDYPKGEYNVTHPIVFESLRVQKILNSLSERTVPIKMTDKKAYEPEFTADNSRLMAVLGDYRFATPRGAIKKIYAWERKRFLKQKEKDRIKAVKKEIRLAAAREKRRLAREAAKK
jgi:nucleoside-diphosphate-sugar epimerase